MNFGIDWVSMVIYFAAYGFARIPSVPPRVGNLGLTLACGVICFYRYSHGGLKGPNAIFVGIAAALGLYYLSKAFSNAGQARPRQPPSDD